MECERSSFSLGDEPFLQGAVVDLDTCASEPIHAPGSIQPHGVLLALDRDTMRTMRAAGDTLGMLGVTPAWQIGQPLDAWLTSEQIERLRALEPSASPTVRPNYMFEPIKCAQGQTLDLVAHNSFGTIVVELEWQQPDRPRDPLQLVQELVVALQQSAGVDEFLQTIADEVRRVSGFDRVMIYRFLADASGCVATESRAPGADSFLGLRYPASDIPTQARDLYLRNGIRLIPDARYCAAPLYPPTSRDGSDTLDLSFSVLRSVSPLHLEYLSNMGVAASMSMSLVVNAQLWGLVACHNHTTRMVSYARRAVLDAFVQIASFQLGERLAMAEHESSAPYGRRREALVSQMTGEDDLATGLLRMLPRFFDYVDADGVAICIGGSRTVFGSTPDARQLDGLLGWLADLRPESIFVTDHLASHHPSAAEYRQRASGIALISLSASCPDFIIWFRRELVETISWAGRPVKSNADEQAGGRLRPRRSFALWSETVRATSPPWTAAEQRALRDLRADLIGVVLRRMEHLASQREQGRRQQDLLIAELDHRVRNMLATIHALVAHNRVGTDDLATFIGTFDERLRAMGTSHSLLTRYRWEGASLREIVMQTMAPYQSDATSRIEIAAEHDAVLRPKATLALSLALHELATNAAKYGALSVPGGRVRLDWRLNGRPGPLTLRWRESGGPPVQEPSRRGFGRHLIESNLSYEIDGLVRLNFPTTGVEFDVTVPWDQVMSCEQSADAAEPSVEVAPSNGRLRGKRILVVEDNALLASSVSLLLQSVGGVLVGPVGRLAAALELATNAELDAAVLDIDLNGTPVWEVADALAQRGVPFLFATGYSPGITLPSRFAACTLVTKPSSNEQLIHGILTLVCINHSPLTRDIN